MNRAIGVLTFFVILLVLYTLSYAQEHRHGDEVIDRETGKFYSTWMQPDNRAVSCCSQLDCYATEARIERGQWRALSRTKGWVNIPSSKIETERDVPVGAHLCENSSGILCFGVGGGT